jgi:hypothetical protein
MSEATLPKGEAKMKKHLRIRVARLAIVAGLLLTVAGGVAYATIPDSGKVFTACMLNNIGTVRLIDQSLSSNSPMSHCTSFETQVTWNQVGQQGVPGPKGNTGAQGPKGDTGAQGPTGETGPQGTPGIDGKNGAPGRDGTNGADAKDGAPGKDGVSVTSTPVSPGDANCAFGGAMFAAATGPTFACNGGAGKDGANGSQGVQGPKGDPGPAGPSDAFVQVGGFRILQDNDSTDVGYQKLDPGSYLLIGKVLVGNRAALLGTPELIECSMGVGLNVPTRANSDRTDVHFNTSGERAVINSLMPIAISSPTYAEFRCRGLGGDWEVDYVRFAAIKLGQLSVVSYP